MQSIFLSPDELRELTGRQQPAAEEPWLDVLGITCKRDADGRVLVFRGHFEQVMGGAQGLKHERSKIDWSSLVGP